MTKTVKSTQIPQAVLTAVPFSMYHRRILAMAIWRAKPNTNDRQRMDDWVNLTSHVGEAILNQGGEFNLQKWMDICFYGPK